MKLADITTMLSLFWDYDGHAQEAADQELAIYSFWVLRGGTYAESVDWFNRLCAQSPLDWRTTSRLAHDELVHGRRVVVQ